MASGGDEGSRGNRMPKDMKGLYNYCLRAADPSGSQQVSSMSAEDKEWLNKALMDMSVSPTQRMLELNQSIRTKADTEEGVEKKIQAAEELIEWCENLDFAIDFHKIGGFDILRILMEHDEPELRWNCMELIGTLVQNNPYCQKAVLEGGLFPPVLQRLDKDSNNTVRTKALFATSCLARDFPDAQKVFVESDGFSILMRAMQSDVDKLKTKAAFMLSNMCCSNPAFKDTLCDMGMIDQLVGLLTEEHTQFHEHLMSALLAIVRDHPRAVQECQRSELGLVGLLRNRVKQLEGQEEFQEEKEYAEELLKIIRAEGDESQGLR